MKGRTRAAGALRQAISLCPSPNPGGGLFRRLTHGRRCRCVHETTFDRLFASSYRRSETGCLSDLWYEKTPAETSLTTRPRKEGVMEQEVIYEFGSLGDAKSAVKRIDTHYSEDKVTGLNFVSDGRRHIVAACTEDDGVARLLHRLLGEHNGTRSSLDLDGVIALPARIKLL